MRSQNKDDIPDTRAKVRGLLAEKRIKKKEVAENYDNGRGCHFSYVSRVLSGHIESDAAFQRIREAVADTVCQRETEGAHGETE